MLSGVEGEVLSLDVPEDPEPSDLIDSTPEVHYAGRVDGSRAVAHYAGVVNYPCLPLMI